MRKTVQVLLLLVMLAAAFLILFLTNLVQARSAKILKGGQ